MKLATWNLQRLGVTIGQMLVLGVGVPRRTFDLDLFMARSFGCRGRR